MELNSRQGMAWCGLAAVLAIAASCAAPTSGAENQTLQGRPAGAPAPSRNTLWYHVDVSEEFLDVHLRLYGPPPHTRFFLPGEWAGRSDYADSIRIAGATAPDGPRDFAVARNVGEVEVDSQDAEWVELRYRVELVDRSEFHPRNDRGAIVAFGPAFLVTPARQILDRTSSIPVEVVTPANWKTVATWRRAAEFPSSSRKNRRVHGFVAQDAAELRDAFLVAGPSVRTVSRENVELAFGPTFEGDTEAFADFVERITRSYEDNFGAIGKVQVYARSGASAPQELAGLGRRGGFVVDVPTDAPLSERARLLVAHEALHLWNGHLLVPRDQVEESTRWFKEGVTHYLALKALAVNGEVGERFVLDELGRVAANYERNPISRGQKATSLDARRFPYDFGVLVALAVDGALHAETGGAVVVEDWLTALLREHRREPYREADLLAALQSVGRSKTAVSRVEDVWRRLVRQRAPIEVRALFDTIDLHWLPETPTTAGRLMTLDRPDPRFRHVLALPTPKEGSP